MHIPFLIHATAYKELVSSRYVCIREASNDQRGILHINTEATFWVRGTNEVLEYQTSNLGLKVGLLILVTVKCSAKLITEQKEIDEILYFSGAGGETVVGFASARARLVDNGVDKIQVTIITFQYVVGYCIKYVIIAIGIKAFIFFMKSKAF